MSQHSVLLVDDEHAFVHALAERLALRGLDVDTAPDGEIAVARTGRRDYDAVLLDMAMPGMDGIATLRAMQEVKPGLQVIVLTGQATLGQAVEAMKLGALDLMEKPADIDALVERIDDAAHRRLSMEHERIRARVEEITRRKGW